MEIILRCRKTILMQSVVLPCDLKVFEDLPKGNCSQVCCRFCLADSGNWNKEEGCRVGGQAHVRLLSTRLYLHCLHVLVTLRTIVRWIADDMEANKSIFQQRRDDTGLTGFSCFQKVIVTLTCDIHANGLDEYPRMSNDAHLKCILFFDDNVVRVFE